MNAEQIANEIVNSLPAHEASLSIEHNSHKDFYQKAYEWIAESRDMYDWENEAAKQQAIETDEIWTLQWYPNTPIGFNAIAAPTLGDLLRMAKEG